MHRTLLLAAALVATVGSVVAAQPLDIRFRGSLDDVNWGGNTEFFRDGGQRSTATCSAFEADLADGGTWPLKVTSAGPVSMNTLPNAVLNECRKQLTAANRMDGG